jgi:hypothetical protein
MIGPFKALQSVHTYIVDETGKNTSQKKKQQQIDLKTK